MLLRVTGGRGGAILENDEGRVLLRGEDTGWAPVRMMIRGVEGDYLRASPGLNSSFWRGDCETSQRRNSSFR